MCKCNQCDNEFDKMSSLRRHYSRVHKISSQEFYNEYVLNGEPPTCKCGCGEVPNFMSFNKGYKEWKRGHISRVKNNWGHNPKAIENSAETRREQFKNGERKVWNEGLTKEDHPSIAKYGKNGGDTINNSPNELLRRSNNMKLQWETNPNFKVRYGKDSPNWKGGTSSITALVHTDKRLYDEWKFPILKEYDFHCNRCNCTNTLQVHHNEEMMSEIISIFVDNVKEYDFDQKKKIANKVIDYHIYNKVSGEILCKECHQKEHPSYNIK